MPPTWSKENGSRDVIVHFLLFSNREKVWAQRFKLNGKNLVIKEDFPPTVEQARSRLYPICKAARANNSKASLVANYLLIDGRQYTMIPCRCSVTNDFVTCRKDIIIRVGGSISQLWNTVRKMKFRTFLHLTLIYKQFF